MKYLGLERLSDKRRLLQTQKLSESNPYRIDLSFAAYGSMPSLRWSSDFEDALGKRSDLREKYESAGYSLIPFDIFDALEPRRKKSSILCWNQGSRPSCSMHGAAHAFQAAELIAIALGAQFYYESVNPIYNFYIGRGGNYAGGLDMVTVEEEINQRGFFPVSSVGDDNISVTQDGLKKEAEASKHQAGIVAIEDDLIENIIKVCKGLGSVCFGSGIYPRDAEKDNNGMRVMNSFSYGGHAQAFFGYKNIGGTEYIWNQNSHGNIYGQTGNEPESGAWITRRELERYCRDMPIYGNPLVVFAEGEPIDKTLRNEFNLPKEK